MVYPDFRLFIGLMNFSLAGIAPFYQCISLTICRAKVKKEH
jgi:hypothetical protein